MSFPEYHKINGLYKRDQRGRFTEEFARDEFAYLYDNDWLLTEKVDGTNIRIGWDPTDGIQIGGRTDNAQIPTFLLGRLNDIGARLAALNLDYSLILYGEGYGAKIQKGGGNYIADGTDFVVFDVRAGDSPQAWWLNRTDVCDVADQLGPRVVPIIGLMPLGQAEKFVADGFFSWWGDFLAEGVVATPVIPLFTRDGHRVITKLKTKDYAHLKEQAA